MAHERGKKEYGDIARGQCIKIYLCGTRLLCKLIICICLNVKPPAGLLPWVADNKKVLKEWGKTKFGVWSCLSLANTYRF